MSGTSFLEIKDEVLGEIKGIETSMSTKIEAVNKVLEDFKKDHARAKTKGEEDDACTKAKIDKMQKDIIDINEGVSKKNTERLNAMETAVKAMGMHIQTSSGKQVDQEEVKELAITVAGARDLKTHQIPIISTDQYAGYIDAFPQFIKTGDKRFEKAMEVGVDTAGGYAVTPQILARVLKIVYETSPMRKFAAIQDTTSDEVVMMVDIDEAAMNWVAEKQASSNTATPVLGERRIKVHAADASPRMTQQMIDDAGFDVEAWLTKKIADKLRRAENTAHFTGDGLTKPRGILTYPDGTAWGQIEQTAIASGAGGATFVNLIDLQGSLKEEYQSNANWFMKRSSVIQVMKITDGDSSYIFKNAVLVGGVYTAASLLGAPLAMANDMATIADNSLSYAYGDMKEAYLILNRKGITVIRDVYSNKPHVELYTRLRVGGDVTNFEAIKIGKVAAA